MQLVLEPSLANQNNQLQLPLVLRTNFANCDQLPSEHGQEVPSPLSRIFILKHDKEREAGISRPCW